MASREHYVIELSAAVPDGTGKDDPRTVRRDVPADGELGGISVGYPDGDVGAGLRTASGESLFPRNEESDFVRYGDSADFPLRRSVGVGDTLVARFYNESGKDQYVPAVLGLLID